LSVDGHAGERGRGFGVFFSFFPHLFFGEKRWDVFFILAIVTVSAFLGRFQLFLILRTYDVVGGVIAVTVGTFWFVFFS
jgi:hypothetical protein